MPLQHPSQNIDVPLHRTIQRLNKRIEYLESLHKCTCPTLEEQSKMTTGRWYCPLHGTGIIHFQSPITRMIDRIEGHIPK